MHKWGVRWVLGMVGHSNLGMAEAIRKLVENSQMNYIGIRHESTAAFACSAYGKLMGKPAACITIAGPGATNLVTGLSDAYLDCAPAIALTGQVDSKIADLHMFQELDLKSIFESITVSQLTMGKGSDFVKMAEQACREALSQKGVSQIIMPDDVQTISATASGVDEPIMYSDERISPQDSEVDMAIDMISKSSKPIILMGEGCKDSIEEVKSLAEKLSAPIMTTYRAKGFVDDAYCLACGVTGLSGTAVAANFMANCDLIIAIGVGMSKHTAIAKGKKILQIDHLKSAIGRRRIPSAYVIGDAGRTAEILASKISQRKAESDWGVEGVKHQWQTWRAEKNKRALESKAGSISPAQLCDALSKYIPANAIVCVDVGNVAYSFGRYFESKNQRVLMSFYLGSIGCGLSSAIGAWCATQEKDSPFYNRPVVAIVGDGGLGQYLADWTTVVKNKMNIKCVVFNNSELAKISTEQKVAKMNVWETSLLNPNFSEFSLLCGGEGVSITDPTKLESQIQQAMKIDASVLIDVATNPKLT